MKTCSNDRWLISAISLHLYFCQLSIPPEDRILLSYLREMLPVITHIVNASLTPSEVTRQIKLPLVTPSLKKALFDPEILNHFRPVSTLNYIFQLIGRVVDNHLNIILQ